MLDVEVIEDPAAAAVALDPVRARLLAELAEPASAAALAARVGLARQKVNYHLRTLEAHGLVEPAGERRWGGLTERMLVATAASYLVSPAALGRVQADRLSARYLIALGARMVREIADLARTAERTGKRLPTLSLDTEIRFATPADRAAFADELTGAVTTLVSRYHEPGGRPHRLVVAAHPLPQERHDRPARPRRDRGSRHARGGVGGDRHRARHRLLVRARRGRRARRRRDRHAPRPVRRLARRGRRPGSLRAASPTRSASWAEGAPPWATEILVEARAGGTCLVRLVSGMLTRRRGLGRRDRRHRVRLAVRAREPAALPHALRRPALLACARVGDGAEPFERAWPAFATALGVHGAGEGAGVDGRWFRRRRAHARRDGAAARRRRDRRDHAHPGDGKTHLAVRAYRFTTAAAVAAREEPAWRELDGRARVGGRVSADVDAIVIGAGHNGLVAANRLAERGWSVLVLEAQPEPGGAVRAASCASRASPATSSARSTRSARRRRAIRALELERHGLRWRRSPLALAHPQADGACARLSRDLERDGGVARRFAPGDGDAWRELYALLAARGRRSSTRCCGRSRRCARRAARASRSGPRGLLRFARFALLPVRRLGRGAVPRRRRRAAAGRQRDARRLRARVGGQRRCSAGCCAGSAQQLGYPVPEGGAGRLTAALVARLQAHGGRIECGARGGARAGPPRRGGRRAHRGRPRDRGAPGRARRHHRADALPRSGRRPAPAGAPSSTTSAASSCDGATVKVDWSLDGADPVGGGRRSPRRHGARGRRPRRAHAHGRPARARPDPRPAVPRHGPVLDGRPDSRSRAGRETAWAYTHVPQRVRGDAGGGSRGAGTRPRPRRSRSGWRREVERVAPGFRALIRARHVFTPPALEAANASLVGGARQPRHRPDPPAARLPAGARASVAPRPRSRGLYLAGASAHPGGGVHGAAGANAAHAALRPTHRATAAVARVLGR